MEIIRARNVHDAFPQALRILKKYGVSRGSRNGEVIVVPFPVVTEYSHPTERVIFWPERDANPFFHLYESLWMLAGRNDIASLGQYAQNIKNYSDDGKTIHGAYGYRWRLNFEMDQIFTIISRLRENHDDRRCVLQMWDTNLDLGGDRKDHPCNLVATFQLDQTLSLEMSVFCRSNDIIWGAYGANAVHFSMLQEYIAWKIGCDVGKYYQISVNWHAYPETLEKSLPINESFGYTPYDNDVEVMPMRGDIDPHIKQLLYYNEKGMIPESTFYNPWATTMWCMIRAHRIWRSAQAPEKYTEALKALECAPSQKTDWIVAGKEWLKRRLNNWEEKQSSDAYRETEERGYCFSGTIDEEEK